MVKQKIGFLSSGCSKNLIAVSEDIEGCEELAEPNKLVAEAVACQGRGESSSLRACPDKEDPDRNIICQMSSLSTAQHSL